MMKKKARFLVLLMVCVMIIGSTLSVYATDCCHNPNVVTIHERANPGTWITKYCKTCKAIYSRTWTQNEVDSIKLLS